MTENNKNLLKNNLKNKLAISPSANFDTVFKEKIQKLNKEEASDFFTYLSHFVSSLLVLGVVVLVINQYQSPVVPAQNYEDFYVNSYLEFQDSVDQEIYEFDSEFLTSPLLSEI